MKKKNSSNSSSRIISLDIFRGLTVVLMIIVNNPGSWSHIYSPLKHPAWDGLSLADLVFPFFLMAVGMSIPIAIQRRIDNSQSDVRIFIHIVSRTVLFISLGIFLNGFPEFRWEGLRLPGVLQRIGIVYFLTCLIYRYFNFQAQVGLLIFILISYSMITICIPAIDVEVNGEFVYSPKNHFGAGLDRLLLGEHLWKVTKFYDPEGIFSTIPSVTNALIGVWWIQFFSSVRFDSNNSNRVVTVLGLRVAFAFSLLALGIIASSILPINKTIWTPAFALVSSSIGLFFLMILDSLEKFALNIFSWTLPFGSHALFVFVFIGLFSRILVLPVGNSSAKSYIWGWFNSLGDPYFSSLLYSLCYFLVVWCVLKIFIFFRKAVLKIISSY